MSKSIRSYETQKEKELVISRRLQHNSGGLGFWAAKDAVERMKKVVKEQK
jgi:hypothetical protein